MQKMNIRGSHSSHEYKVDPPIISIFYNFLKIFEKLNFKIPCYPMGKFLKIQKIIIRHQNLL